MDIQTEGPDYSRRVKEIKSDSLRETARKWLREMTEAENHAAGCRAALDYLLSLPEAAE